MRAGLALSKVHYIVRRSRLGRFNFTLISEAGRITGVVVVPTAGRSGAELEHDARLKIRCLAETFAGVVSPMPSVADDEPSDDPTMTDERSADTSPPAKAGTAPNAGPRSYRCGETPMGRDFAVCDPVPWDEPMANNR